MGLSPGVCVCVRALSPRRLPARPIPGRHHPITAWGSVGTAAPTRGDGSLCRPFGTPLSQRDGAVLGGVPQPSRVAVPSRSSRFAHAREPVPVAPGAGSAQPRPYTASIRSAVTGGCAEPREGMRDEGCPRSRVRQRFAPLSPAHPFSWPRKQHWGGARVAARCAIVRAVGAQHEDGHRSTIPAGSGGAGQGFVLAVPTVGMGRSSSTAPRPYVCSNPAQHPWDSCNPHPNGDRALCLSSCSVPPPHPPQQGSPTVWRSQKAQHQLQSQSLFVGSPPPANQSVRRSPRSAGGRRTPHSHPTLSSAPLAEEPGPSPPQGMAPHINTDIQITKIALEYSQMNKNYSDMYSRARALCTQPGQPGGPGGLPGMRSCS